MANSEFGRAVRRWRERVPPEAAGLPAGGNRRTTGLRREELAMLAGISVDYITRLEQGRASHPSSQVVEALARALRLTAAEHDHLFHLAGLTPPGPDNVPARITPSVQHLLDRMPTTPVAVFDAAWTQLVANPPYAALMGDPSGWRGHERNAVWRNLVGPGTRVRLTPESRRELEATLVADLGAAAGRYPADQQLQRLVADLRAASDRFTELWDSGAVGHHETARKIIDHPHVGAVELDCDMLTVAGSDLRIMIYTAIPGSVDAERLALITVLGTQSLTG
jgi:transcriptional regulator with XRE-family HTH domain